MKGNMDRQHYRIQRERRRKRMKYVYWGTLAVALTVLLGITMLLLATSEKPETPVDTPSMAGEEQIINLAFAGDVCVTDKVVDAGITENGYDYSQVFMDILPLLADADNTVVNFEGIVCGEPYGSANNSAPPELLKALKDAGVDMVQVANSCTINNGLLGLGQTLDAIRSAGMEPLGAYASPEEFQKTRGFTLRDIQGVKVAFVAFTKGMDNLALPEGQQDCVNLLYNDYTSSYQDVDNEGISALLQAVAAEEPDITIALLHWGSEYNSQISKSQERIVKLMKQEGVDAIIGTHSHYVQTIDFDEKNGTLVAYSLGDLLGETDRVASTYSAVLNLRIAKNHCTGQTRVAGFEYEPIYNLTRENENGLTTRMIRINKAIEQYEANDISALPEDTYHALVRARDRVDGLFEQKKEEDE